MTWIIELPDDWDNKSIMDAARKLVLVGAVDDGAVLFLALSHAEKDAKR